MLPSLSTIKDRRKKLGWTQKMLASQSGVSQSTIAKIERGTLIPSYEIARRIFEALDYGEYEKESHKAVAKNIMTTDVIKVTPQDKIEKVSKLMKHYAISQIPVADGNDVVGIITEENILYAFERYGSNTVELHAGEIMDLPPPIVREETHIKAIVELLKQYPAVLVMKGKEIKGIITKSDIIYTNFRL